MKYHLIALAASSIFGGAAARAGHQHHRRHEHPKAEECVAPMTPKPCQTIVKSYLVEVQHTAPPPLPPPVNNQGAPTTTIAPPPDFTELPRGPADPEITTCPTPGTYSFPPQTVTLTKTEYICVPNITRLPPGAHTIGGVTTIVDKQTTIVCPVPDVVTIDDTTTYKVKITTFVCPSAGTYTINPVTTTITETADCEFPTISEYRPGTYIRPETVITITETQVVVTCPYLETKTEEVTVVPVPSTQPPAPTPTTTVVPKPEPPKEEPPKEEDPEEQPPVVPPHSGPLWAITYSPFVKEGGVIKCKDAGTVNNELADIAGKGFKSIRLYSPECSGLTVIAPAAEKHGLKLILGVFIKAGGCRSDAELDEIIAWKKWNLVELIVIGNEALFQGFCSGEGLAAYIREAKGKLRGAGYNGPVTTTEPLNILQQHGGILCGAVDVYGINIHPYFNPEVEASAAGDFVNGQIAEAKKTCDKEIYVLEAGWPNAGNRNGKAIPSPESQKVALGSIRDKCPMDHIVIFTYQQDSWKEPGAFNVEQNFGARDCF